MNRVFLTTRREWIELIIATVLLWLLMNRPGFAGGRLV